ncbi:class I SAM-dependent methyltransferase [Nigerium massiliense]|uniref:class I SAM-dependent methyltransferase n=1 Tax=Nigerium massiliense TaxID=1522317 RepID=UPI00058E321F|nr:class I SAM-dependent methyltransferase [Nigerium massiliense]
MTIDVACTACHRAGYTVLTPAGEDGYRYLMCSQCGNGRIDPAPIAAEPYDRGYFVDGGARAGYTDYEADEPWHRRTARTRLGRVADALHRTGTPAAQRGRIVDVGAATGFFLDEAAKRGWDASAVELSSWAAERARARGFRVESDLAAYAVDDPFDAVCFFQVLEHVPDAADALARASALLRPGGVVVCETWDAASRTARIAGRRWQQLSPPSVLWLFTEAGIRPWLQDAGLRLVSWRRSPKIVSLATVAGQALPDGRLGDALRRVGSRVGVPYPLDDLVTFVAVKPR